MADTTLDTAVKQLVKYFNLYTLEELVDHDLRNNLDYLFNQAAQVEDDLSLLSQQSNDSNNVLLSRLQTLIVNTQRGALLSRDLAREMLNIEKEFEDNKAESPLVLNALMYFDDETKKGLDTISSLSEVLGSSSTVLNENPNQPDKNNPSASVIQVFSNRISISNKNTNALSISMNAIPTIEISRAVPILDIEFQLSRTTTANDRLSQLSVLKLLNGAKNIKEFGSADKSMASALPQDRFEVEAGIVPSSDRPGHAGIELFTMPQTLTNPEPDEDSALRATPIIDPFRPFASIKSFDISVVPAPGIMSYRTAKLNFILHDRSRMHEIADFIKPDQYNKAEILVEYGWSHPAGEEDRNVWGDLINAMRSKEKYYVKNNNFVFKDNGEVDITLDLYTKGAVDFYQSNIYDGGRIGETQREIERLQEKISEIRNRIFKQDQKFNKEIRGAQILQSAGDGKSELDISPELRKELNKTISSLGKSGSGSDATELRQLLINLYGSGKKGIGGEGKVGDLRNSIAAAMQEKLDKIIQSRKNEPTPDPFLGLDEDELESKERRHDYVSLAKLMLLFIVEPLGATNKFDDIQLIFYTFNDHAGAIQSQNIGSYAIDISNFQEKFRKIALSKRSVNLNLRDFIHFIVNNYLEDISSVNYGMRHIYDYEPDKETGSRIKTKRSKQFTNANTEMEKVMRANGIVDGIFKIPHIDFYIECVPADATQPSEDIGSTQQKTILRIHVFDKAASSYSTLSSLMAISDDKQINTLGDRPQIEDGKKNAKAINKAIDDSNKIIRRALEAKLIETIGGTEGADLVYKVRGGPQQLKEFLKNSMPHIDFGINNSFITAAGLQSMTDNKLATINMIRAGVAGPLSPSGVGEGGLPMQVLPAQMSMVSLGNPLVEYAQQFFVDFQSGTSVDNVYLVSGIDHSIAPGKFQTKFRMTPIDAFGKYRSMVQKIGAAIKVLKEFSSEETQKPNEETEEDTFN